MISEYFFQIEKLLSGFPYTVSIETSFEAVDIGTGWFKARLKLIDQSELSLCEYVEIEGDKTVVVKYRYHWQDKDSNLIIRWDNAKHHPEIKTFPDHLHDSHESNVKTSNKPELNSVLLKISEIIESKAK